MMKQIKPNHLMVLCRVFNLGNPIVIPTRVLGGLVHTMWQLTTSRGRYAVKQLTQNSDVITDPVVRQNYELSEQIAASFAAQEIPVISAIAVDEQRLFVVDGEGFLVYPWSDAQPLAKDLVCEKYALQMAEIAAKMHSLNVQIPEASESVFSYHANDHLLAMINRAEMLALPYAEMVRQHQALLVTLNEAYSKAIPELKTFTVISHGDLDQKNILVDADEQLILIDWECARKLNPLQEIVDICLNWSGLATNLDTQLFAKMIDTYCSAGGVIDHARLTAAFYGVLGNWLNWCVYNMERSCVVDESEQKRIGIEQVQQVVPMIIRLHKAMPELIEQSKKTDCQPNFLLV